MTVSVSQLKVTIERSQNRKPCSNLFYDSWYNFTYWCA